MTIVRGAKFGSLSKPFERPLKRRPSARMCIERGEFISIGSGFTLFTQSPFSSNTRYWNGRKSPT